MKPEDISDVFSNRLRLAVIASLVGRSLSFMELREITQATDGNLSVQLSKLKKLGMVTAEKTIVTNKLVTIYQITPLAIGEFKEHVRLLESILDTGM